jgi:hypothetical protein
MKYYQIQIKEQYMTSLEKKELKMIRKEYLYFSSNKKVSQTKIIDLKVTLEDVYAGKKKLSFQDINFVKHVMDQDPIKKELRLNVLDAMEKELNWQFNNMGHIWFSNKFIVQTAKVNFNFKLLRNWKKH